MDARVKNHHVIPVQPRKPRGEYTTSPRDPTYWVRDPLRTKFILTAYHHHVHKHCSGDKGAAASTMKERYTEEARDELFNFLRHHEDYARIRDEWIAAACVRNKGRAPAYANKSDDEWFIKIVTDRVRMMHRDYKAGKVIGWNATEHPENNPAKGALLPETYATYLQVLAATRADSALKLKDTPKPIAGQELLY